MERDKAIKREEALGAMVYNKTSKHLDMGNLRATEYKFNRFINLPANVNPDKEALHNVRKEETKKVLERVIREENIQYAKTKEEENILERRREKKKKKRSHMLN